MADLKILVGVNFSQCSTNALTYALSLYKGHTLNLQLLHVTPPLIENGLSSEQNFSSVLERNSDMLNALKRSISSQLTDLNGSVDASSITGYPDEVIPSVTKQTNPFVVVLGSSLKVNTIAELLGSITSDIIKKSSAPILTVPLEATFPNTLSFNVLLITDFKIKQNLLVDHLAFMESSTNLKLHCIHFCNTKPDKFDKQRQQIWKDQLTTSYPNLDLICNTLIGDDIHLEIQKYLAKNQINLIAMSRNRRHAISRLFHPDITKKLLFNAKLPILIFNT